MIRRSEITLGIVVCISAWLLSSCGSSSSSPTPPQSAPAVNLSATSLTFTGQLVGTSSATQSVTLTNSGNAALSITGIALSGTNPGDFSQTNTCGSSVAAGANCSITATFTPTAAGSRSASLGITDNASGSPQSVSLSGTGTAPTAAVSPSTETFSSQLVGTTSSPMTVTLSNTGTAPLTVSVVAISGPNSADFAQTNTCGTSVAAGANCTLSLTFTPSIAAAESATLTITDNSGAVAGSTQDVALSGTGSAAFPTVSGTVTKGAVSGATVTVYEVNANGSNGTAIGTGTTGSDGSFSVTLTAVPPGAARVAITGGSYTSEWSGSTVTSSSTVTALLDSVPSSGMSGLSVTAVSTFVDANAAGSLSSGSATSETSAHASAESLIIGLYGFHSPGITIETLVPTFTSSSIGTDGFLLGLIIGTLDTEGSTLNSSDPDSLISAMAADIADGLWNGLDFGAAIPLGTSGNNLPATAGTSDFESALGTYVSSGSSPMANGITSSNVSTIITSIDTGVAICTCTPAAVGLASTSSGAINSMAFTPPGATTSHQYVFIAARTSGVVVVDVTDPTAASFPTKVWQQLYLNQPGSGGFGSIAVGGVIPFSGSAGHPQLLALAYGSKHILILNANTLVTATPWSVNPVDAEMDVPIKATSEVEFSGGAAYIGSGIPLGGSILALATADGYMIFNASSVPSSTAVETVYPVQDPQEIIAENLGGDPKNHYLLAANESTCEGFGCPGAAQLVDLSAGVNNGVSYYMTPTQFETNFPQAPTANSADANSVDPAYQVGIITFEDTPYVQFVNMATKTETVSTTPGVLNSWAPAAGGEALVTLGTAPIISGSAVDPTKHLAYFMAGYSTYMAVGQLQNPATVPAGTAWAGLSDWSFYDLDSAASLNYEEATDPHADGVVYNILKGTPYGYELNGNNLGVVQTDLAGFLAIPRAGASGDAAHQPDTDPTTVTDTTTGGPVMEEITWGLPLGVTTTTPPNGTVETSYSYSLSAINGTAPYTWALTAGALPAGLALSSSGTISGTPTTVGSYTFSVTVTDSTTPTAMTVTVSLTINIEATPPTITTSSLAAATLGTAYSATLAVSGGQSPYTWSITGGALPTNLVLAPSTGIISGTPTVAGVVNFTVTVTDSSPVPQTNSVSLSITVNNTTALSVPATVTLPAASIYSGYSDNGTLTGSFTGGTPPFTCTITSGTLPAGLSQSTSNSCAIQGVPTATADPTVTISVTDSNSVTAGTGSTNATITVNAASSNGELSGQYAIVLSGYDIDGYPLVLAASFTADGNGGITGGVVDYNNSYNLSGDQNLTFTGSYGVGPDNRGGMVVTDSSSASHTFLFSLGTLNDSKVSTHGHIQLFDTTDGTAAGHIMLQNPTAFANSALNSSFAFALVGGEEDIEAPAVANGVFTANGSGALSSGETDYNLNGLPSAEVAFTGTYSIPTTSPGTTNGRGTGTFVLPSSVGTVNFAFYVVSPTLMFLITTDSSSSSALHSVLSGWAVAQTGAGSFSNSSLDGVSVFTDAGPSGSTSSGLPTSKAEVGLLKFDGMGDYTLSGEKANAGTLTAESDSGTYSVEANGRTTITSSSSGSGEQPVFYLVAPGEGMILGTGTNTSFGTFEPQSTSSLTFSGSYFFGTYFGQAAVYDSEMDTGVITVSGSSCAGTSDASLLPSLYTILLAPGNAFTGTCSVSSTGAVTVTGSGLGGGGFYYIVSPTQAVGIPDTTVQAPTIVVTEQ